MLRVNGASVRLMIDSAMQEYHLFFLPWRNYSSFLETQEIIAPMPYLMVGSSFSKCNCICHHIEDRLQASIKYVLLHIVYMSPLRI